MRLILGTNNDSVLLDVRLVENKIEAEVEMTNRMRARAKRRGQVITMFHVYDTEKPYKSGEPRLLWYKEV